MAGTTFMTRIVDGFVQAGEAINAALEAAGLDPLVDWLPGEPYPVRESNAPYGWFEIPEADGEQGFQELGVEDFEVPMLVVLALEGNNPSELLALAAQYVPVVTAAIERQPWEYEVLPTRWAAGPGNERNTFRVFGILFKITGQRAFGGVE